MPIGFDKVKIANMALGNIGVGDRISSFDDRSPEASAAKLWYDPARIAALEAYNWSFARKSQALAQHDLPAPEMRWRYRYQVPSDYVAARMVENPAGVHADAVPYEIETADDGSLSIVTDMANAKLIYTFDQQNVQLFSMHFTTLMAFQMSVFLCYELAGKFGIVDRMQRQVTALRNDAPNADASASVGVPERDAIWIRERS